jgi:aminoglycoside 6'-N-acetyltransferase
MSVAPSDLILRGDGVTLRPSREADVDALVAILAEPAVVRWWRTTTREDVLEELGTSLVIVLGDRVIGWLLVTEETEPDYRHVAFDIALATAAQGQGYGREALAVAIRHQIGQGHHRFTIDPAADNERAIRCYAALGFRPVGLLREHERWPDGRWGDSLLMELLARELTA